MVTPALARWLLRLGILGFLATLGVYVALFATLAQPGPLFAHARGGGLVTFHATEPLPPEAGILAREVTAAFTA